MNNNTESETTYDYIVKNIFNEINTLQTLAPIKSESYNTRCSDLEVQNYGTDVGTYYIRKVEQKVLIFSIVKNVFKILITKEQVIFYPKHLLHLDLSMDADLNIK